MVEQSSGPVLREQTRILAENVEFPHDSALVLLAHVLGESKTWVLAHPELYLSHQQIQAVSDLSARLARGEPLAYLTGKQAFYGLDFKVNPDVLIPRPETELMVEQALKWLSEHGDCRRALDLGTGSGCIAISLAVNCPDLRLLAVDISARCLMVAIQNAIEHEVLDQIRFVQSDLLEEVVGPFHLICANLPYIPSEEVETVNSLPYEPKLALDGGWNGLSLIEASMLQSLTKVQKPYLILYEFQSDTAAEVEKLAKKYYPQATLKILNDLAGRKRLLRIEEA